jgi:hypothetical protein
MNRVEFQRMLMDEYNNLPFTNGLDDGCYNEGVLDGFMGGALWAYDLLTAKGSDND